MSDQSNDGGTVHMARWPKILLIVSLAVNVIVIGLFAGHMIQREPQVRGADNQINWIIKLVPETRRDATKAHFREIRDDVRATYMQRGEHLTAIAAAIKTEPFETTGLQAALQARRDGSKARQELVQTHLVELLAGFTPEERAKFAENLEGFLERLRERSSR